MGQALSGRIREAEPAYEVLYALSMDHIAGAPKVSATIDWSFAKVAGAVAGAREASEEELFRRFRRSVESSPKLSSAKVPGRHGSIETVPLESIYVEHEVRGLATLDDIWRHHRVAVLGEDGLGKSAFLKRLNLMLLRQPTSRRECAALAVACRAGSLYPAAEARRTR